jgi:hypothetical protein
MAQSPTWRLFVAEIESKLTAMGLVLPPPLTPPKGIILPFQFVRIIGSGALVSGHRPQNPDGSFARPLGKLGADLSVERCWSGRAAIQHSG